MNGRLLGWLFLVLLLQGCAATVLRTGCDKPRVSNFGAPTSHVIVLPHGYSGSDEAQRQLAQQLNELARLQALQAGARMPLTQVTFVEGAAEDPACDIEEVYDRVVSQRTAWFWRKAYHSAVFVWGEVFPHEQGLQVQSQLRVFWNGDESRQLQLIHGRGEQHFRFVATLPTETVRLPIFTVSPEMQRGLRQALVRQAGEGATPPGGVACPRLPERFVVERWKPPWLELTLVDGQSCWLWVDPDALDTRVALRHVLLGRAVAAYLSHRVQPDVAAERAMRGALRALRDQLASESPASAASALAWADIMEATANWSDRGAEVQEAPSRGGPSAAELALQERLRAAAALHRAAVYMPNSAEAVNLAALGTMSLCCEGPDAAGRVRQIQSLLQRAHQLDPANAAVLANRVSWLRLLKTLPAQLLPFEPRELPLRLDGAIADQAAWDRFSGR